MKSNIFRIFLTTFFLLLGKAIFDITLFSSFFNKFHTLEDLAIIFGNICLIGFLMIIIFNYLQRAFRFGIAIAYTYLMLFSVAIFSYYHLDTPNSIYLAQIVSCSVPLNLVIILAIKGIIIRTGGNLLKRNEKFSNIAGNSGVLMGSIIVMALIHYFQKYSDSRFIHYIIIGSLFLSIVGMANLFRAEKKVNTILDNLQEIKVKQNIFKLLSTKYFTTILLIAGLSAFIMFFVYGFFIKISVVRYQTPYQLTSLFSICTLIFSISSLVYEIFFKERIFYSLGVKNNLLIMPIVILIFCLLSLINIFYFKISYGHEFYFFVPIFAILYLIFSHFSFINIFFPVVNTLYLPLDTQNQNDFYIKSSFLGFIGGIGASSLAIKYLIPIPLLKLINDGGFIIVNLVMAVLLILINRNIAYRNYKTALHKRLDIEGKAEKIIQDSFVYNITKRIKEFSGIKTVRVVNLLYLINPVKSKQFLSQLTDSENILTQRSGLISSIKLYLLEIYEKMLETSKTKYFPSSPNRDKIEQLLGRFEEVKTKMQKANYIQQLSISKKDIERVYGGMLAVYAPKEQQPDILGRLIKDPKLPVAKNAIISSAGLDDPDIIKSVIDKLDIAELSNAAYSALLSTNTQSVDILENTFYQTGQSEKVQIKIVRLLGDIANETAVEYLFKKLNYTNQNIISAALKALSKCNISLPEKKAVIIKHELDEVCKYLIWNTSLSIDLENNEVSEILLKAVEIEIEYNYKSMFDLLALLYNPGSIELIRKNLKSNDYEKVTFALELASVVIKDEMKPMILPLLKPISKDDMIKRLQTIFTTEKMNTRDILYDIIQRDFKWINPWTKACAIMEILKLNNKEDIPILLANMVNPDPMLAELSALSIFTMEKSIYFKNKNIFDNSFAKIVGESAIEAIESRNSKNANSMPVLKFEIIKYLQEIEEFSSIPGEILKYLTDEVTPLYFKAGDKIEKIDNLDIFSYHYIIYSGKVNLYINDSFVKCFEKNTLLSTLDLLIDYEAEIVLQADCDTKIYKIDPSEFADYLSFYDEIPFSIVENTPTEKIKVYEKVIRNEASYKKQMSFH